VTAPARRRGRGPAPGAGAYKTLPRPRAAWATPRWARWAGAYRATDWLTVNNQKAAAPVARPPRRPRRSQQV